MTVEQPTEIDLIGIDNATGAVHLTVADHLEWNRDHMITLQEKLNAYLAFIESGEIFSTYPYASEREILINLVLKYRPNDEAIVFLTKISVAINNSGFAFHYGPSPAGYEHDQG
ncbi:MAG: hypothetical protein KA388_06280 [Rhodocyclaceae bacterium]|nr:hypothetical protein [Rhodocyclaceae bacterium]MBK9624742.1 hypothetical protein [Rhodocyclaceae bacterium]MBL0077167.1 hypothetical protein [Rhodocyclaceae bacterium]MBP6110236.1 hypothetical protein [Rhodocyclaceae bacterium]MBP6279355.1 hypothetical protein [Rhodocyclaceae bacterium]